MRSPVDRARLLAFLGALGERAGRGTRVYLVGGATAVLYGWRDSTVDIDLRIEPDSDAALRSIPRLKDELQVNVELASPADFLPEVPGWRERSPFVGQFGELTAFHYDLDSQALAKIERAHVTDRLDVAAMLERGLVERRTLAARFADIEPTLFRFPAVDPKTFRERVEDFVREPGAASG